MERDFTRRLAITKQFKFGRCQCPLVEHFSFQWQAFWLTVVSVSEQVAKTLIALCLFDDFVAEETTTSKDLDFNPGGLHSVTKMLHQYHPTSHLQGIQGYDIPPSGNILAVSGVLGGFRLLREVVPVYADEELSAKQPDFLWQPTCLDACEHAHQQWLDYDMLNAPVISTDA